MPELPEVTITSEYLNTYCKDHMLIKIIYKQNVKKKYKNIENVNNLLPLKVIKVSNKGKYIYIKLNKKITIISHMMLHGEWSLNKNKFTRLILKLQDKNNNIKKIYYNDFNNLGSFDVLNNTTSKKILNNIAPSVFDNIDYHYFISKIRKKNRSMIYGVLMDQNVVISGVGNYIANEVLYRCKINPKSKIVNISDKLLKKIFYCIVDISYDSYTFYSKNNPFHKKSPNRTIVSASIINKDVKSWYKLYNTELLIYKKEYDPLGNIVIKEKINGRMIHWVPSIQIN